MSLSLFKKKQTKGRKPIMSKIFASYQEPPYVHNL